MEKNTAENKKSDRERAVKESDLLSDSFEKWRNEFREREKTGVQKPIRSSEARASESIELNLKIPPQNTDDIISVKDIVTIFKKGSVKIFTVTLISLAVALAAASIYCFGTAEYLGTVTGIISFNYKGAETGLDPYGRVLDVTKIRSPQVLDNALTELNLHEKGLTSEDVRQNILIKGIVPEGAMQRIMIIKEIATKDPSKLEQLADVSYISTQYAVTLNIPVEFAFLKESNGTELLSAIFQAYQKYFFEEYGDKDILSTAIASLPYSEYDYDNAYRVLDAQLTNMTNYLAAKQNNAPDFRANSTQMSFGDIITNVNLLKTIDLTTIRSLVEVRLVSKDKNLLISTYQSIIIGKTMEKNVQLERARIMQETAIAYQKDAAVMFGAGITADANLQFAQPGTTYDSLVKQAAEASETAVRLQNEIEYYEQRIAALQDPSAVLNSAADIALVETAIDSLSRKMAAWIKIINETVDEYMETEALKDATKIVLIPQYTSNFISNIKIMGVIVIAVVFMGFLLSTIAVYLNHIIK